MTNVQRFSEALAANADGVRDFLGAVADVGRAIKPLTATLTSLAADADTLVKSVDPTQVKAIVGNVTSISAKLNATADKLDTTFGNLNALLASDNSKGVVADVGEAAKSIRRLADNLDSRTRETLANLTRFSNTGLKQYEALAIDGRKTLDEITQAVRSIESNPTQFLFGKKTPPADRNGAR